MGDPSPHHPRLEVRTPITPASAVAPGARRDLDSGGEARERLMFGHLCRLAVTDDIVAIQILERNPAGRQISSPMGVVELPARGLGFGALGTAILEVVRRNIGAEIAFYFSTLKNKQNQRNAEKSGFRLVVIVPAFDRDEIAPGVIRRVYEAIYAKPLVRDEEIGLPNFDQLTPTTQALFSLLFRSHDRPRSD